MEAALADIRNVWTWSWVQIVDARRISAHSQNTQIHQERRDRFHATAC